MKGNLASGIVLLIVAVIVAGLSFVNNKQKDDTNQQLLEIKTAVTPETPYQEKEGMKQVVIIENFDNKIIGKASVPPPTTKTLRVQGTLAKGYVYVVANVDGRALITESPTNFDSVYLNMVELTTDGSKLEYGGHLIESKSLETPKQATSTELLFPLSAVVYKKTFSDSDIELATGNWLELLNDKSLREMLLAFSSTIKGTGTIERVVIYYSCADGSSCSISAE